MTARHTDVIGSLVDTSLLAAAADEDEPPPGRRADHLQEDVKLFASIIQDKALSTATALAIANLSVWR